MTGRRYDDIFLLGEERILDVVPQREVVKAIVASPDA